MAAAKRQPRKRVEQQPEPPDLRIVRAKIDRPAIYNVRGLPGPVTVKGPAKGARNMVVVVDGSGNEHEKRWSSLTRVYRTDAETAMGRDFTAEELREHEIEATRRYAAVVVRDEIDTFSQTVNAIVQRLRQSADEIERQVKATGNGKRRGRPRTRGTTDGTAPHMDVAAVTQAIVEELVREQAENQANMGRVLNASASVRAYQEVDKILEGEPMLARI